MPGKQTKGRARNLCWLRGIGQSQEGRGNLRRAKHPFDHPLAKDALDLHRRMRFLPQLLRCWQHATCRILTPEAPQTGWSPRTVAIVKIIVVETIFGVIDRCGAALGCARCWASLHRVDRREQRVSILTHARRIGRNVSSKRGHVGDSGRQGHAPSRKLIIAIGSIDRGRTGKGYQVETRRIDESRKRRRKACVPEITRK